MIVLLTGNGEIDFEEFLTLMTSTEKYLAALDGKYYYILIRLCYASVDKLLISSLLSIL